MIIFDRPNYIETERKFLLDLVPTDVKTILDVGCNRGTFGKHIKKIRDVEVWGIEPDVDSADIARTVLDRVINDVFQPENPIPDNYFDLITFNDSLEHMQDPATALELSKKKLKKGGRVQCCVPNMRHIENIEHLLIEKNWRYEESGIRDRTHLRFFTEKSIIYLFENMGFKIINILGNNEDWWHKEKYIRRFLFRIFKNYTRDMRHIQIVIIAEPL